jgi:glyoxylase I family protein
VWRRAHRLVGYHSSGAAGASPAVPGGRNVDHLCIATSPFAPEAMRAHLAAHGVAILREATHGGARGMGHSFYIRDPFGNVLEIKGPAEYPDGRG